MHLKQIDISLPFRECFAGVRKYMRFQCVLFLSSYGYFLLFCQGDNHLIENPQLHDHAPAVNMAIIPHQMLFQHQDDTLDSLTKLQNGLW